ncbi:MAG TPA: hypothetical protein VFO60_01555, partial [Candidatus Dormibacteraeota bacterium]|nr:hypothetical protein [Candidatus Dormibacteraeota bacterium]
MGLEIVRLRPGPEAVGWLVRRVAGIQRGDALAPVTVVVPSHHAGLFLRRRLATVGYANVRFALLTQLAEAIGAGAVARQGRTPLTAIVRNALVRDALRAAGEPLASAADDAGLVD